MRYLETRNFRYLCYTNEFIETEIDDLLLPYIVDLSLYSQIDNAEFLDHIQRVGKMFYQCESR